ncbi:MAG: MBOAT family O-acyltransferase [Lachnospirales bacterium]
MIFNSIEYILFLPIVIILYYTLPYRFRWVLLLLASYIFYMVWNVKYIALIIFSTLLDYIVAILMEKKAKYKKKLLCISLLSNLGILFFFKYFNFFADSMFNLVTLFGFERPNFYLNFLLPMGISFYTFQTLSYTIDVYKGERKAERHLGYFALYVTYFPQLVAGPIERSDRLLPVLQRKSKLEFKNITTGLLLMACGFFKKVIIADRLAVVVDNIFSNYTYYTGIYLVIAMVFFTVQIYCDFSGYSLIARGSAKLMGHDLMINFKYPFFSKSIKEFWSRWHISLSTWFRDYVYIPLGGGKKGRLVTYRNILIVFLLSGLWHGASFTFVLWGLLNGIWQIFEDIILRIRKSIKIEGNIIPDIIKVVFTFFLTTLFFTIFRATDLNQALYIISYALENNFYALFDGSIYTLGLEKMDFIVAIFAVFLLFFVEFFRYDSNKDLIKGDFEKGLVAILLFLIVIVFGFYGEYDASSFIYFQF